MSVPSPAFIRRLVPVVGALALGVVTVAPAHASDAEPSPRIVRVQDAIDVPLERYGGVWMAEVVLNGIVSGRFIVDTGASICAVSPELARRLGIVPGPPTMRLSTANGVVRVPVVHIESMRVGNAEVDDVRAVVLSLGDVDGLLGNTFLWRFHVGMDTARGILLLQPR